MKANFKLTIAATLVVLLSAPVALEAKGYETGRPRLLLTDNGAEQIKAARGTLPAFDASIEYVENWANRALSEPIVVPIPVDGGGGYTHEQHKTNYYNMYHCGIMYQLTDKEEYAKYVKDMLYQYAAIYTTLPPHPDPKSNCKGRLFWQSLNEYVWLVHTAGAYDCVYEYLSAEDHTYLQKMLFYPVIEFLSASSPTHVYGFNRMHNHGTWATAAVGMMGFIMDDEDLVQKALYGSEKDGNGGFLAQLDYLFSPDGYFTEGAFYHRYAIWPFVVFAQALDHNMPQLDIYNYRNATLKKSVDVLLQQAYHRTLLKYNDAMDKTLDSQEIVNAVDAIYQADPTRKEILSIAADQNTYIVSDAGLLTARAVAAGEAEPYVYRSELYRDGSDGTRGGLAILRSKSEEHDMTLLFKATSHGLSHGQYDKLCFSVMDNGHEILPDFAASRFLNIEPKNGGQYTAENYSYSRQSIAHNTVIVDQTSHFGSDYDLSMLHAPTINFFGDSCEGDKKGVQIVSAHDTDATPGVKMNRTMAMIETPSNPLIIDIFRVNSTDEHTYDMPFYYREQLIDQNINLKRNVSSLHPFGEEYGYQHLWVEGEGAMSTAESLATFTWYNDNRFYSVNSIVSDNTKFYQVRTGANDPDENLLHAQAIVLREQAKDHTFVSTIESHGLYDIHLEVTEGYQSNVQSIETLVDNSQHSVVRVTMKSGVEYTLCVQNEDSELIEDRANSVTTEDGQTFSWMGDYALFTK
ncbi:MAG: heparinase II/III family protein [Rikenellaceae bacterium]